MATEMIKICDLCGHHESISVPVKTIYLVDDMWYFNTLHHYSNSVDMCTHCISSLKNLFTLQFPSSSDEKKDKDAD